jgi:hypothetical protein
MIIIIFIIREFKNKKICKLVFCNSSAPQMIRIGNDEKQTTVVDDVDVLAERGLVGEPLLHALVGHGVVVEHELVGEELVARDELRQVLDTEHANVVSVLAHAFVEVLPADEAGLGGHRVSVEICQQSEKYKSIRHRLDQY